MKARIVYIVRIQTLVYYIHVGLTVMSTRMGSLTLYTHPRLPVDKRNMHVSHIFNKEPSQRTPPTTVTTSAGLIRSSPPSLEVQVDLCISPDHSAGPRVVHPPFPQRKADAAVSSLPTGRNRAVTSTHRLQAPLKVTQRGRRAAGTKEHTRTHNTSENDFCCRPLQQHEAR